MGKALSLASVYAGSVSNLPPPGVLSRIMQDQRAVPRTRLVRVADSNDPTPLCQPEAFNAILAEFLNDR